MSSGYNQHNLIFAHSVVLNYCCQRQEYQAFPLWALYEEILQNYSRTSSKKFQTYIAQIWNNVIQHMLPANHQDPKIKIFIRTWENCWLFIFSWGRLTQEEKGQLEISGYPAHYLISRPDHYWPETQWDHISYPQLGAFPIYLRCL